MITLTTDFGCGSHYVAQMKGVILGLHPQATIVDITHGVAPQSIREAAWVLREIWTAFPRGTIHLAVVDPGVGSARPILAVQFLAATCVLPDNGLLSYVLQEHTPRRIVRLTRSGYWRRPNVPCGPGPHAGEAAVSATFHGRDIMAPVAAHLDRGVPIESLGDVVTHLERWSIPQVARRPAELRGEIVYCDTFGNAVTNLSRLDLQEALGAAHLRLQVGSHALDRIVTHYAATAAGQPVGLIGSGGHLEIAVVNGNAAQSLGLRAGDGVRLRWTPPPTRRAGPDRLLEGG